MQTPPAPPVPLHQDAPPAAEMMRMISGYFVSQALYVVAKLGVADLLRDGERPVEDLAAHTRTHAPSLHRFMRALASVGVFAETPGGEFALTPLADLLRADADGSLRDFAIFMNEDWHWRVWEQALHSVRTGEPAINHVYGMEAFPWFAANPEAAHVFDRAMTCLSRACIPAIVAAYDFSGVRTLADIAGGHGSLLAAIMRANPSVRGILFDQPYVLEGAPALLAAEGVEERCALVPGDFFASIPAGADAYLMKHIIHDWDEPRAQQILANVRDAMVADDARLLLVEMIIPERNAPHPGKWQDLEMLLIPGGQERTAEEYRRLLEQSGFRLTRIIPTASPLGIVEAIKN